MSTTPHHQHTLSDRIQVMDAAAARTQRLCSDQPLQAEVRRVLLSAEKTLHEDGWDRPPKIFHLQLNDRTGRVRFTEFEKFSRLLIGFPNLRPPDALGVLTRVTEYIRAQVQAPAAGLDDVIRDLPPEMRVLFMRARGNPDADLFGGGGRDWRFLGVGMAFEGWTVIEHDSSIEELARNHRLYTHPDRVEMRQIFYVARDGLSWDVQRLRHAPPGHPSRYCVILNQENNLHLAGSIPHMLSRMCNAIASNPVPVTAPDR